MRPEDVEKWLSEPRFAAFLDACDQDHQKAVALYNWNVEISAAFFEVLHHVEVLLRNATDRQFPSTHPRRIVLGVPSSDFWITDSNLLIPAGIAKVEEAAERLTRRGHPLTRGRLIATLSFGFWRSLYGKPYAHLWGTTLRQAFPNGNGKRKQVAGMLESVRQFRNRIAHHEAIFDSHLPDEHSRFLRLADLIDRDARVYIAQQSRVPALLAAKPI